MKIKEGLMKQNILYTFFIDNQYIYKKLQQFIKTSLCTITEKTSQKNYKAIIRIIM